MSLVLSKYSIGDSSPYRRVCVLEGEVKRTNIYYHKMRSNEKYILNPCENIVTIFFLLSGKATFLSANKEYKYDEKAVYVNLPQEKVEILTQGESELIEIKWPKLGDLDKNKFPYTQKYYKATQYRDACKSEKSISRMIVDWDLIPGFAFGSVETEGYDIVSKHCHPDKDQIFFSFKENNIKLLINDDEVMYDSKCFVHIPLASDHGVKVEKNSKAHYLWIDFEV